jgi:putative hydrolase of the HAD superfamily
MAPVPERLDERLLTGGGGVMVIFDLDGVLCDFDAAARLASLTGITGIPADRIHGATFGSQFECDAEAGIYRTGAEYLAAFNARLQFPLTREQWIAARRVAMRPRPEMLAYVARLRKRVPVAVLTNNGALLREALPVLAPEVWQLFGERCHASCEFAARKPEPRVYTRLLARYQVAAESAVFVDDSPGNVVGARAAGLHGVVFAGLAHLEQAVESLLAVPGGPALDPARPRDTEGG